MSDVKEIKVEQDLKPVAIGATTIQNPGTVTVSADNRVGHTYYKKVLKILKSMGKAGR